MSTRSNIGIQNSDGSVDAVYCHFDGYPAGVGRILLENYKDAKTIRTLISKGLRCVDKTIDTCEYYDDEPVQHFASASDYANSGDIFIEYHYLRIGRTWYYNSIDDRHFRKLTKGICS